MADETDAAPISDPIEQRSVVIAQAGDDGVLAARLEDASIFVPVRPLCTALGLGWSPQLRKIRADDVLSESTRNVRLQTRGGPQVMLCMDLEAIPLWLAGIEPSRVREDLRERLRAYKRWVRKVVYEAFARETGIETALTRAQETTPASPDMTALAHIAQMAEAIATMARQQMAFEARVDTRVAALEAQVVAQRVEILEQSDEVMGRLDQAAAVVGNLLHRMTAVEGTVAPGQVINDAQAAEISALVKAIATEMATRQGTGGTGRNAYQAVFGELYRRFRVSSYHNIPLRRFGEVMAWLREYQETPDAHGDV